MRNSLARFGPTSNGHMRAPPSPATRPMLTCGSPNLALCEAKTTSQHNASVAPSPMASPFTEAMIGWVMLKRFRSRVSPRSSP